jgi:hypothetical protein
MDYDLGVSGLIPGLDRQTLVRAVARVVHRLVNKRQCGIEAWESFRAAS